jgi:hypothetical protein
MVNIQEHLALIYPPLVLTSIYQTPFYMTLILYSFVLLLNKNCLKCPSVLTMSTDPLAQDQLIFQFLFKII